MQGWCPCYCSGCFVAGRVSHQDDKCVEPDMLLEAHCLLLTGEKLLPKTLVSLATYLLSGDEPQAQHSNCVLQGLEVTILATTTFFLLKMFFSVLFSLCENENECLPCVRLAHAVEEITENPEGLG